MLTNAAPKKLVVIMNAFEIRVFAAQGIRIIDEIDNVMVNYSRTAHPRQPKHQGYYGKLKTQSHFFDSHREAKDIERQEYAKSVTQALENFLATHVEYKQLIIVAEAKMLGEFRKGLSKQLQHMVSKEITKDMLHSNKIAIEAAVFN